jgi:hypothetical protein
MERRKSKHPLLTRVETSPEKHPWYKYSAICYRCGAGHIVLGRPLVFVGNQIEGDVGVLCVSCSREYILRHHPEVAAEHGLLDRADAEARRRRINELNANIAPISMEERERRRNLNREEGNLCIACEDEPKEGFEGKYARDLCQTCYEIFVRGYVDGNYDSLEDFLQRANKMTLRIMKHTHWH